MDTSLLMKIFYHIYNYCNVFATSVNKNFDILNLFFPYQMLSFKRCMLDEMKVVENFVNSFQPAKDYSSSLYILLDQSNKIFLLPCQLLFFLNSH